MANWTLRKFNEGDIENFLDWRKHVARRHKTQEFFEWEYLKGPWGPVETWLADDNGKIVGQYSTQRYEAFYFGKKVMASLSFDTGTHPDYRRQGIFVTLGAHHFKEEGKQDILFSTGFPNENFWPGGQKFGWHGLCTIPELLNENVTQLSAKKPSRFEIYQIKSFDRDFEGFSENFKDNIPIYLNRTRKYLGWRFVEKPGIEYYKYKIFDKTGEMVAYFVTKYFQKEQKKFLHLIDFLLPNEIEIYKSVLNFIINDVRKKKINNISLFLNRYHPFKDYLHKHNFRYIDTNRVYIIRSNSEKIDENLLFQEKNNYFTMADHDVF
ncbi:MAG: GNAT family N-acetyltransferase [Candidatus Odinarchaeota archaeon]